MAARCVDRALDNQASLAQLLAAIAVFNPWGLVGSLGGSVQSLRRNAPQIEFGVERIDDLPGDESTNEINITNAGGSPAKKVRTGWYPGSSCDLLPPLQPFTLLLGGAQQCEFVVRSIAAHAPCHGLD